MNQSTTGIAIDDHNVNHLLLSVLVNLIDIRPCVEAVAAWKSYNKQILDEAAASNRFEAIIFVAEKLHNHFEALIYEIQGYVLVV